MEVFPLVLWIFSHPSDLGFDAFDFREPSAYGEVPGSNQVAIS